LPAAPAAFIGRIEELIELSAALNRAADSGRTVAVSVLTGAGGIGKTWLALHWAHRHIERFPDGQLFVDLHGFSPAEEPMDSAVAVRGFLEAFGVDRRHLPTDMHSQVALYRSLVADKRVLVVLDNAATVDQIIPLLPGSATCTVMVTSRRWLTGLITAYGAQPVHLDVLSAAEARRLLATHLTSHRVAAEPDAVTELVARCSGFPLALAIVAGRSRLQPRLPLAALAAELRHEADRLNALDSNDPTASLPTVLSWSLRALAPEQREMFGLLGIVSGPDISLGAVTSLTALPAVQVKRLLGELEEASLLDHDGRGRYRMHDLIRTYATTQQMALHTAYAADRLLNSYRQNISLDPLVPGVQPHPLSDVSAALAWMDAEYPNLLAAQRIAITNQWHQTVWELAWVVSTFHYRRGRRHEDVAVQRAALDAAHHLADPSARVIAQRHLGRAYVRLGQHEEAIKQLHQALASAEHQQDFTQQAHTRRQLAWAWGRYGNYRQALEHATQALALYRTLGRPEWEADALNTVGWHAALLGDYDVARAHCQNALALHRLHDNPTGEADTLASLGWIDYQSGLHQQAVDHYQQALDLYRSFGHAAAVANALDGLGHPHAAAGRRRQAQATWREALKLYREQGRDEDVARVQRQLGELDKRPDQ
jgi:tetratricopeptide (TPR) repeat protein